MIFQDVIKQELIILVPGINEIMNLRDVGRYHQFGSGNQCHVLLIIQVMEILVREIFNIKKVRVLIFKNKLTGFGSVHIRNETNTIRAIDLYNIYL